MAAEDGHIDVMFLGPTLPGRWIPYWTEQYWNYFKTYNLII